ncbi:MADS box transcription factor [Rhynchospora pubera]|uniref:MADS box transcription factor n=1 Tax=Rhynchospora pubera TaxID=906938 RepID=A0AAV8D0Z5_9POAL|nr:MADS box transcription factor [Rhynchospora pubera]
MGFNHPNSTQRIFGCALKRKKRRSRCSYNRIRAVMSRGRVELRRIENKASRLVSFSKRSRGLLKKAHELSVMCDADVGLIIFSAHGRLYEFSTSNCMEKIIDRYRQFSDVERVTMLQQEVLRPKKLSADSGTGFEAQKLLQRSMDGLHSPNLNLDELNQLEKELETALVMTMTRKTQLMMEMIDGLKKGNALLRERNYMQSILDQHQSENGGINEAASRERTKKSDNFEIFTEKDNTFYPCTISTNIINSGTEPPGVFAENRHACQCQMLTHPFF